jgi:hypothetical protein
MKKIYFLLSVSCIATFVVSTAFGQVSTVDAEFRPRTEIRQGFRKPLADSLDPALITFQRTRLNADYKSKVLNARISLQDARIWGNSDNKTNTSKVELYEGWFEYLITSGISIQMGRQALKYDDQRLISAPNWSNTGCAHDVIVVKHKSPFIQAHAGFAYNNSKDTLLNYTYSYTPKQNYKELGYVWISKEIVNGTTLSAIGIYEGFEKKTDYTIIYPRVTYGGNLVYASDSSNWGGRLTAYKQQGKDPNKTFKSGYADVDAYLLAAKVTYSFAKKYTAHIGFDMYSGSDTAQASRTGKTTTFYKLYGSAHSFSGNMEYYISVPNQGLLDYYGGISAKITPIFSVDVTGHMFAFNKDFYYKNVKTEKNLGSEIDVVCNYNPTKEVAIQAGWSMYSTSPTANKYFKIVGVDVAPQHWAYIMLTIKPQFYKTLAIENK